MQGPLDGGSHSLQNPDSVFSKVTGCRSSSNMIKKQDDYHDHWDIDLFGDCPSGIISWKNFAVRNLLITLLSPSHYLLAMFGTIIIRSPLI